MSILSKLRKCICIAFMSVAIFSAYGSEKIKNVIVAVKSENLSESEKAWLLGSVKDKFESNLQLYAKFNLVSSNESGIRELQKKSESIGFDEKTAIEIGKLTSASHAVFLTVRRSSQSYSVTAEFADLTTGKNLAKSVSDSRSKSEELSAGTGCALDLLTIDFCERIGIPLSNSQKYFLKNGNLDLSDKEKIASLNQEISDISKQITNFDAEILKLKNSGNLDAQTRMQKLESEKALAEERKKAAEASKLRLAEIEKARVEEEALNEGRSLQLRNKILDVSSQANAKAQELRKLKSEKLSVLERIGLIESKKAAFIEISKNVKKEKASIASQISGEYEMKISALKNQPWRTAEKNADGTPTEEAVKARNEKILALESERKKSISAAESKIEQSTCDSRMSIIADIVGDQENLTEKKYFATSLNGNLMAKIGNYDGKSEGWETKYAVLCDGVELFSSSSILKYEAVERLVPSELEKFDAIDVYDSLFKCGEPVLTFMVSYSVDEIKAGSEYKFRFSPLSFFDTRNLEVASDGSFSGKSEKTGYENSFCSRKIMPANNWESFIQSSKIFGTFAAAMEKAKKVAAKNKIEEKLNCKIEDLFADIPGQQFKMMKTEMTQFLYREIMGENPSKFTGDENNPVENVSWYDAIYFCNKFSEIMGFSSVYAVDGSKDTLKWKYIPHKGNKINSRITQDLKATGFRLPTNEEWNICAKGEMNEKFSGSNNAEEVAWHLKNSDVKTHPVGLKKSNKYGVFDMSGNVNEWVWDSSGNGLRVFRGGDYKSLLDFDIGYRFEFPPENKSDTIGFRIVRGVTGEPR